ncbi:anthranilate phosphoribosyltransferase [Pseudobutyrivibrio sp. YE44]|uniref:anthranilate phosphoribosyltransferase n=1 Tax=Pseudobutyrivibrio sp. YE44 TaxID=1520802 RepID=UPI00088B9CD2|nr:anthranilate phosphoribosyltransferase [Pseudobutyrivibrio sp. YE44]SDB05131.1 anthranilate phosphoribosyltransferase [Pseudobutyrivibrio sp. YE44]
MIKEAIVKIVNKEDLTYDEAYAVMNEIMNGDTSQTQNAAFLAALSTKSAKAETTDEIAGCAAAMREHATKVETGMDVFEIVGTGGDNAHSFNISTTSALIAAAGGMKVAKHGNRAASSLCGTADCLEALGVNIKQDPEKCVELLDKVGMCFFFAQKYHTSMKYVGAIRKELGFRTVFNILGPLTNPATPTMQLLGVYDEYLVEPLARVLTSLGVKRGMVVYGMDKLDEISMSAETKVCEINNGEYKTYTIKPEDFGFNKCTKDDLKGGTPEENAKITREILKGAKGPKRDAVLMNAGASLYIGGKAESFEAGIKLAAEIIDSGKAFETLEKFILVSNQIKEDENDEHLGRNSGVC